MLMKNRLGFLILVVALLIGAGIPQVAKADDGGSCGGDPTDVCFDNSTGTYDWYCLCVCFHIGCSY
jgi:hypothetical protein